MRHRLIIFFTLSCVLGAGFWSVIYSQRVAKADTIATLVGGSAYGLAIKAQDGATRLSSGPYGEVSTLCTPYPTNQKTTLLGVSLFHGFLTSSSLQDKLTFARSDEHSTAEASSTIEHLTLGDPALSPLLEIDGLHAIARSHAQIGLASSETSASFFGTVRIAGLPLPLSIAPNTRLVLPGLGTVVLNEQIEYRTSLVNTYAEVNMLDITLGLDNLLHQPAGTRILIGHSVSTDTIVSVLATMQGHAYGFSAELGLGKLATVKLGPTPETSIGCTGGTSQASAVDLRLAGLVDTGSATTSTSGVVDPGKNTVVVTSLEKITNLSLFGGLIRAGLLQAYARAVYTGHGNKGDGSFEALRLSIGKLKIVPHVYTPDLRVNLPGLGYVIVNEIIPATASIGYAINALDIHITTRNHWHLAVGLRIIIGHVDANITTFH